MAGQRRNRFAEHSHNFLTQDGRSPSAIAEEAKAQLEKYSTISWLAETVTDVKALMENIQLSQVISTFKLKK
jgi:hypothetical protein